VVPHFLLSPLRGGALGPRLRTLRSRRLGTALHRTGRHPRRRSGHCGRLHALPVRKIASRLWRRTSARDRTRKMWLT